MGTETQKSSPYPGESHPPGALCSTLVVLVFSISQLPVGLKGQPRTLQDSLWSVDYKNVLCFQVQCSLKYRIKSNKWKISEKIIFIEDINGLVWLNVYQ